MRRRQALSNMGGPVIRLSLPTDNFYIPFSCKDQGLEWLASLSKAVGSYWIPQSY